MLQKLAILLMVPVFFLAMTFNQSAYAEWYAGGAIGVSITHDVDDLKGTYSTGTASVTSFSPDTSFTGGIKGGYFFENIPYFGVEINWSISDPDVNKEAITATITGTPIGAFTGQATGDFLGSVDVESVSSFGFLAMLRVTDENAIKEYSGVQPFLGLGFTVSTLDVNSATIFDTAGTLIRSTTKSDSSTDIGFLLSTGLNYIVSNNIKVYGEYKFQTVDHTSSLDDGVSYELTNESSSIVFGASYSF
jgi:opacity protein-like surface antigen